MEYFTTRSNTRTVETNGGIGRDVGVFQLNYEIYPFISFLNNIFDMFIPFEVTANWGNK